MFCWGETPQSAPMSHVLREGYFSSPVAGCFPSTPMSDSTSQGNILQKFKYFLNDLKF